MGARSGNNKVEKIQKAEKWKNIKVPESVWRKVKVEAAKKGIKIYKEIKQTYG